MSTKMKDTREIHARMKWAGYRYGTLSVHTALGRIGTVDAMLNCNPQSLKTT